MSTYKELLKTAYEFLKSNGVADADVDSWYLLTHVFGLSRVEFFIHGQEICPKDKAKEYMKLIEKRANHIPLQYLLGTQEFMGLEFEVNEDVLIPRQETELLVEEVLKLSNNKSVLDLCTGSGCIIISLAKLGCLKRAVGVDISEKALQVADRNRKVHKAEVEFIKSDLFDKLEGKYDIIISNPPYIKSLDLASLMPEVKDWEPVHALDGGPDGLRFYKKIISDLYRFLNPGGHVFFEIGYDQGQAVKSMLQSAGLTDVDIKKDYSGHDRIVYGRLVLN